MRSLVIAVAGVAVVVSAATPADAQRRSSGTQRTQERAKQRAAHAEAVAAHPTINVTDQGKVRPLDLAKVAALVQESCEGLGRNVDPDVIMQATLKDLYEGVPVDEVRKSLILSARAMIEKDPAYSYVTARLLLHSLRLETVGEEYQTALTRMEKRYRMALTTMPPARLDPDKALGAIIKWVQKRAGTRA